MDLRSNDLNERKKPTDNTFDGHNLFPTVHNFLSYFFYHSLNSNTINKISFEAYSQNHYNNK